MYAIDLAELEVSLTRAIERWWENMQDEDIDWSRMPLVGPDLHVHMAHAALSVLKAVDDAHEYLRDEKMLKED